MVLGTVHSCGMRERTEETKEVFLCRHHCCWILLVWTAARAIEDTAGGVKPTKELCRNSQERILVFVDPGAGVRAGAAAQQPPAQHPRRRLTGSGFAVVVITILIISTMELDLNIACVLVGKNLSVCAWMRLINSQL